jgi:hypothetical protein
LLGWLGGTASKLTIEGTDISVMREVDGGLQTVKLKGPAIITTDLRLNEPRYASLPNIMKAKKKPIADKTPADYGVDVAPRLEVVKTTEPSGRKAGVKVKTVAELVEKLKNEAGSLNGDAAHRRARQQIAEGCDQQGADRREALGSDARAGRGLGRQGGCRRGRRSTASSRCCSQMARPTSMRSPSRSPL